MSDEQSQTTPVDRRAGSGWTAELTTKASSRSVAETVARMESLAEGKGMKLFAVIDHSGEAEAVGSSCARRKSSSSAARRPAHR